MPLQLAGLALLISWICEFIPLFVFIQVFSLAFFCDIVYLLEQIIGTALLPEFNILLKIIFIKTLVLIDIPSMFSKILLVPFNIRINLVSILSDITFTRMHHACNINEDFYTLHPLKNVDIFGF